MSLVQTLREIKFSSIFKAMRIFMFQHPYMIQPNTQKILKIFYAFRSFMHFRTKLLRI